MSTITYSNNGGASAVPSQSSSPARKPIWRRIFDAMVENQQRRADREIARFLANHGGMLTDEIEREVMRRFAGDSRRPL